MFDLRRSLRRIKPHRISGPVYRRPNEALRFVTNPPSPGRELWLDTCVYIDVLQGKTPRVVDDLLKLRTINHLAVCVAELTHCFGRLDPGHPHTSAVLQTVESVVDAIPAHRLETSGPEVVIEAGILAGLVCRLCGLPSGQEVTALNDATLYLHALANGQEVLTRNLRDFDVINQILPDGQVLFYECL
jgi:hypothetical protein